MLLTTTAFIPIATKVGSPLLTGGTILGLIVIYVHCYRPPKPILPLYGMAHRQEALHLQVRADGEATALKRRS
jgi:hypothetical protein